MIVVKIELHSAITRQVTLIGSMIIHNTGGTRERCNYDVAVAEKRHATDLAHTLEKPLRKGVVKDYPRLSYNVWRLVVRALKSAFPEEK